MSSNGVSNTLIIDGAVSWAEDTWYHIAWTREGNDFRLFVDGTLAASTTSSTTIHNSTGPVRLGKLRSSTDYGMQGFVDDFRMIIGMALYTENFTPPTAAHPTSSSTMEWTPADVDALEVGVKSIT